MSLNIQIAGRQLKGRVRRVDGASAAIEVGGQQYALARSEAIPRLYGDCWVVCEPCGMG